MKYLLSLTILFAVGIGHSLHAEEAAEQLLLEARTFELYREYLTAQDWQMAEIIARGALAKFGRNSDMLLKMRAQIEQAADGNRVLRRKFDFLPQPKLTPDPALRQITCTYRVVDLLQNDDGQLPADAGKRLEKLQAEVHTACFAEVDQNLFSLHAFHTNLSLVVSATQDRHDQIIAMLKQKRASM
ncbi:hypothetical protein [Blastopirellula marina]|uniref:Uncharacterized protein n=1 Tax=Blastopirellula marina TaxID=124 RepID=A0A2S8GFV6_9BACT|nr:hypothetical protein [Blastopirellula marina]PQO43356.1 hypothetical protein C5Y98_00125 [Blastopirellula marina]PTL46670.1 hypothetical protein C5Y97_00125 [Blastopirellula marina]